MSLATLKTKVGQLIEKAQSGGGGTDEQYESLKESMAGLQFTRTPAKTIVLDCSKFKNLTSLRQTFNTCPNTTTVYLSNTEKITDWYGCFYSSANIISVYGDLDLSSATNITSAFQAARITNISFVPNTIKLSIQFNSGILSAESIQSIIDGLATVETAQTLTLAANPKILQSQVDSANAKGWTVAGGTIVSEEEYYG